MSDIEKVRKLISECTPENLNIEWIRNLGSNCPFYFRAREAGFPYLQQVPEEYLRLLQIFYGFKCENYLEIGVGNGGSFILNTQFLKPRLAVAVDNLSYQQDKEEILSWIKENKKTVKTEVHLCNSADFFKKNTRNFDVIFIDGDHSYEGVKEDFENSIKILNENGIIILHDISSIACQGVVALWNEIKNSNCEEIIQSFTCGIGVWRKPSS